MSSVANYWKTGDPGRDRSERPNKETTHQRSKGLQAVLAGRRREFKDKAPPVKALPALEQKRPRDVGGPPQAEAK